MSAERFYRRGNRWESARRVPVRKNFRMRRNEHAASLRCKREKRSRCALPVSRSAIRFYRFAQWKWERQGCRPETRLGTLSPNPFFASRIKNSRAVSRCPAASFILPSRGYFPVRTFQTPCSGYPASASSPPPAPRECSCRSRPRCPQSPRGTGRDSPPPP